MTTKQVDRNATQLRQEAEAQLARATKLEPRSAGELLLELQMHQVKLEMQNEQLRQAQVELEESRDRYMDLYEFAPIGYLTLSPEGMVEEINLTGATLLGMDRNKLPHHRFITYVASVDRDRWYRHFLNVLKHEDTLVCELALQHEDCPPFFARLDCRCLKKYGEISGVRIALTDITQRKPAKELLRDSREISHRLLNSMTEGAYGVDTDGNCTFVNLAFLRMLGYQNEHEVLGKHIHELIHHSHADGSPYPASECRAYLAYRAKQLCNITDEVFWHKDGTAIPVEYWSHPVEADGTVIGAIVSFFDITARKQAESLINAQLHELHRWQDALQGREMRVLELKREVNGLLTRAGQPLHYPSAEA